MSSGFNAVYNAGGRFDPPFYPSKPVPYIKGHKITAGRGFNEHTWTVPVDVEFIGVSVSCSAYESDDNWSLKLNGNALVSTSYTKDLPEGMFFTAFPSPLAGAIITFEFYNSGKIKDVWFNYQLLKDE